jgi:hypothetical protein
MQPKYRIVAIFKKTYMINWQVSDPIVVLARSLSLRYQLTSMGIRSYWSFLLFPVPCIPGRVRPWGPYIETKMFAGHIMYTLYVRIVISIKVVPEQSGKVEYECERLLGIANKFMIFFSDSQQAFRARIRLFHFARGQPELK